MYCATPFVFRMSRLAQGYRDLFGTTGSPLQLYGGFTAFTAGCAMGLAGILIALSGEVFIEEHHLRYKTGILIAAIGLPLIFMGLQVTLPSRFIIHAIAGAGMLVCYASVLLFYSAWPYQWGPRSDVDRSAQVIGVYTMGLVLLVTTTAAAIVTNFVTRHLALLRGREQDLDDIFDGKREVTMEEVLRDIEREVARQKLTWGGVEEDRLPKEYLKLSADFGPDATISKGGAGVITMTKASEMQSAFDSLARLRGVEGREVADEDDTKIAIEALRALRAARKAERERSWRCRIKRMFVGLFTVKTRHGATTPEQAATHMDQADKVDTTEPVDPQDQTQHPGDLETPVTMDPVHDPASDNESVEESAKHEEQHPQIPGSGTHDDTNLRKETDSHKESDTVPDSPKRPVALARVKRSRPKVESRRTTTATSSSAVSSTAKRPKALIRTGPRTRLDPPTKNA